MATPFPLADNHLLEDPAVEQVTLEGAAGSGVAPEAGRNPIDHARDPHLDVEMVPLALAPSSGTALVERERSETLAYDGADVRPTGVDSYMKGVWATGLLWIITYLILPMLGVDDRDNQTWPVVVTWIECVAVSLCVGIYVARHVVRERVPIVMKSMLAWQVLVLNAVHAGVSIALPASGFEQTTVPGNIVVFVGLAMPVVLDACNTTPTETRVSLTILIFALLLAMIGNILFFENAMIYEGFSATVDSEGRQVWTGQFTKNGVRLNILNTVLLLLMGSLFTAFAYDKDHTKMYFCKLSRAKPE